MGDNKRGINFDPKAASLIMKEEAERARQLIINHIRINGQNASGKTIASLRVEQPTEDETILWGHRPFGVLETGRRAGKIPYGFAGIIRQWMKDKGLRGKPLPYKTNRRHKYTPQERGDMSMASAIAHTIATKGSKLHRTGGRADVYSNVIPDTMGRLRTRLISLIHTCIGSIKLNTETI